MAQLVARMHGVHEAAGSSPASPTIQSLGPWSSGMTLHSSPHLCGLLAQLVERCIRIAEATGSNPVQSIKV